MSSTSEVLHVPVVMGLVVLLLFSEIVGEVAENSRRVGRAPFKCRDASRAAPAGAALHADDDVFVEKTALFQKPHGGFRREFIRAEFADADEIAQALGLFGFRHLQEW